MLGGLVIAGDWNAFLTLENEKLLLVKRKHAFAVVVPILLASFVALLTLCFSFFFFFSLFSSIIFFIISILFTVSIFLSLLTKAILDWYFNIYILTNRKMLEIRYTPLVSHSVSEVLLDKVNCTEVDLRIDGFFNELIDRGDVIITFDRPTHQEEFVLRDMKHPGKIGKFLSKQLIDHLVDNPFQQIWYTKKPRQIFARQV